MKTLSDPRGAFRQAGLSLVELMIGMVLGLLVVGAAGQYYLASKMTFNSQTQNGRLQEAGRFALEFMARDLRMGGFTGCGSRGRNGVPLLFRNYLNSTVYPFDVELGVSGHEASGSAPGQTVALSATNPAPGGSWAPALPAGGSGSLASQMPIRALPGSDTVVVRSAGAGLPLVSPYTSGSQIFADNQPTDIDTGDIVMVSDCLQMQVFQATNVAVGGTRINIVGSRGGAFSPGNAENINARGPVTNFGPGSEVSKVRTFAYFVGQGGDGTPALYRESLEGGSLVAEELISGVESMQVLYGVDATGNLVVDNYVTASAVADWSQVLAVRIALLVRSPEEFTEDDDARSFQLAGTTVNPVDDRRQRRVFETTIALRNRMP